MLSVEAQSHHKMHDAFDGSLRREADVLFRSLPGSGSSIVLSGTGLSTKLSSSS